MMIHPQLHPYLQQITQAVVNSATNNRHNQARVWFANNLLFNGQPTALLNDVVGTVCDFITLNVGRGNMPGYSWGNIVWCIEDAVGKVLTMFVSAAIAKNEAGLMSQVAPPVIQEAQMHTANFNALVHEINQMKMSAGATPQQMGMGMHQGYVQQGYPQQMPYQQQQGQMRSFTPSGQRSFQPVPATDNYFSATPQPAGQTAAGPAAHRSFVTPQQANQQFQAVQQPVQPVVVQAPEPVATEPTQWYTSEVQPYQPIYCPSSQAYDIVMKKSTVDSDKFVPVIIIKGSTAMNRDQHQTVFQGVRSDIVEDAIFGDAVLISPADQVSPQVVAEQEAIEASLADGMVSNDYSYQFSTLQEAVINVTYLLESKKLKDNSKTSAMTLNMLTTPVITKSSYWSMLERLSNCETIKALVKSIKRLVANENMANSPIEKFLHRLDLHLTKEFNRLLATRLSIDTLTADSFVDDCEDVVDYIERTYGQTYSAALKRIELQFIESAFNAIGSEEEHASFLDTAIKADILTEGLTVTFISQFCTTTRVDVNSASLDVGFVNNKVAGLIRAGSHKQLTALAVMLFERISDDYRQLAIAHHYLITNDDKIYELHESAITKDDYLISLVSE
jgi:hypothetical protein